MADESVEPSRHRGTDDRRRRLVLDRQDDPHALRRPRESETAALLDQAGFGYPTDLARPLPAIEAKDGAQWKPERQHLDRVASPDALWLRADRFPPADAFEDLRDAVVIGEEVKGTRRCRLDDDRHGDL